MKFFTELWSLSIWWKLFMVAMIIVCIGQCVCFKILIDCAFTVAEVSGMEKRWDSHDQFRKMMQEEYDITIKPYWEIEDNK